MGEISHEKDLTVLIQDFCGLFVDCLVGGHDGSVDISSTPFARTAADGADVGSLGLAGAGEESAAWAALFGVGSRGAVNASHWR